ncbi:MAG TPA: hypothetical protein DCE41_20490, partial [Cytophagales bacterium]|nr:hypothetical protein [Cytophagales bacterium]
MVTYKTPGVKIREVATLPPSVVQVSTAIPAFVGYTTEFTEIKSQRITSLKEYEDYFGGPVLHTGALDGDTPPTRLGDFFLHEAIRAYFLNGGGPCHVITIGTAGSATISEVEFQDGLDVVETLDEPTLVLCPEAVGLDTAKYGTVADAMLNMCERTQDRFALLDTPTSVNLTTDGELDSYRGAIKSSATSYGASYFPHLSTIISYSFDESVTYGGTALSALATSGKAEYQDALNAANSFYAVLPPSVFVAGVCAKVDQDR